MSANGRVLTGFSKPYVALYSASGTTITYSSVTALARGVGVQIDVDDAGDDNNFWADNQVAESVQGVFTGGTATLTVDGLLQAAEKMIFGLPTAGTDGFTNYDDDMVIPYVGIGFVARYMSDGTESFVPYILNKCKFKMNSFSANTQSGDDIDWQTQELEAVIMRDDGAKHCWKRIGTEKTTEADAENAVKTALGYTPPEP